MNVQNHLRLHIQVIGYRVPAADAVSGTLYSVLAGTAHLLPTVEPEASGVFLSQRGPAPGLYPTAETPADSVTGQFTSSLPPVAFELSASFGSAPSTTAGPLAAVLAPTSVFTASYQRDLVGSPDPVVAPSFQMKGDPTYTVVSGSGMSVRLPPTGAHFAHGEVALQLTASGAATLFTGARGEVTLTLSADGSAVHENTATSGAGFVALTLTPEGHAGHGIKGSGAAELGITPDATATHFIGVRGAIQLDISAAGEGKHTIGARGNISLDFQAIGVAQHVRYEVRGEVRESVGGVLLPRSVRVYHQGTGELVGMVDATLGRFQVHCGLTPDKYVIMPIDLSASAEDYTPPTLCNVESVIARDAG